MGTIKRMLEVDDEDVLNLENIRNIMMNLNNAAKVADLDIVPEMCTLNGLIDQFKVKSKEDIVNKRRLEFIELLKNVYGFTDTRTYLLYKDIEHIIAKNS